MTQKHQVKYRLDYQKPSFTITDIQLTFDLTADKTVVTSISTVNSLYPQAKNLVLSGESLTLHSVCINDKPWHDYVESAGELMINNVPPHFQLTIINEIKPIENTALEGLYVSGNTLCTQCEAEGFRYITYYLDRPDILARFTTKIIADKYHYPYLLSNGNRVATGDLEDGRHWVEWQDPFPKPCYLFALVAGKFDMLQDTFTTHSGREIVLELYVDQGNLERSKWAMASLKNAMRWDEERFNLEYDLDIYMIVAVDFFNMGAMENKGLNIFNSKFVLAKAETATDTDYLNIESVIGHEYFHNWTGNRITCRDWFQLSLKEGLTVFRDQEFSSDIGSRSVNRINNVRVLRSAQFAEDASPMAHPIRPDKVMEMNNFYTLTVYEKGAEVIRMMHTLLGEQLFQAGMQLYFERHDGSAVTCDDFVQAMQDASRIDLSQFKRWYSQSGTPELTVTDKYDAKKQVYTLMVEQYTPPTADQAEKLPLHIPLDIELYAADGNVIPLQEQDNLLPSVLNIRQSREVFTFDHVKEKPIISLLRDFSAPVKLYYNYSDNELIFLIRHATDDFARYDATQQLLAKYIKTWIRTENDRNKWQLPPDVVAVFRAILTSETLDPALIAQLLMLPTENEIAQWIEPIDPDAIHFARTTIIRQFAHSLKDEFLQVYQRNLCDDYQIVHQDIAKRAIKNSCLYYLTFTEKNEIINQIVQQQYQQANNMTDAFAALSAAVSASLTCSNILLSDFEQRWYQDGLVMDKWFSLQATVARPETLSTVKALMTHRSFSFSNPNRIRALIGAFVTANPVIFHDKSGSGYQFLTEILITLNRRNPQIASRLIEPLIRFKHYEPVRQHLMKQALEKLSILDDLSNDLYEKVTKALA